MDPFKNIALFKDILNYFNKVVHMKVFYNLWIVLHLNLISGSLTVSISTFLSLTQFLPHSVTPSLSSYVGEEVIYTFFPNLNYILGLESCHAYSAL